MFTADDGGDFEVQPKRTVIEIGRANGGHVVVDQCKFSVQETLLVPVDFATGRLYLVKTSIGSKGYHHVVGLFRNQDPHVDAAQTRQLQRPDRAVVRNEIRACYPYSLPGRIDSLRKHQRRGFEFISRTCSHDNGGRVTAGNR